MANSYSSGNREFLGNVGPMMRYDPAKPSDAPVKIAAQLGLRSATQETPAGLVYTCSKGSAKGGRTMLYRRTYSIFLRFAIGAYLVEATSSTVRSLS